MGASKHAARGPLRVLERRHGLAEIVERGAGVRVCWQVASQYLVLHLTHRGASWASGAAQAAQFVRIILRFAVSYGKLKSDSAGKTRFVNSKTTGASIRRPDAVDTTSRPRYLLSAATRRPGTTAAK